MGSRGVEGGLERGRKALVRLRLSFTNLCAIRFPDANYRC